jgi:hypothetical protein
MSILANSLSRHNAEFVAPTASPPSQFLDDPDSSCGAQWCSAMILPREIIGWVRWAVMPSSHFLVRYFSCLGFVSLAHTMSGPRKTHSPPLRRAITVMRREHPPRRLVGVQVPGLAVPLRDRLRRRPPGFGTVAGPGQWQAFLYRWRQCAMTWMTTCQSSCPRPVAAQQGERLHPPCTQNPVTRFPNTYRSAATKMKYYR